MSATKNIKEEKGEEREVMILEREEERRIFHRLWIKNNMRDLAQYSLPNRAVVFGARSGSSL